jgi:pimeloyl-ACP methyl ester carboxylesterase
MYINYEEKGHGDPILLVHGWGGDHNSFKKLADLIPDAYRVIRIDLPGFGKSDLPKHQWGVEEFGRCLVDFLKTLNIGKVIYFGHSFGGSLGIYLAAHYPKLISKLILCAPSYKREAKKSKGLLTRLPQPLRIILYRVFFPHSDLWRFPRLEPNFRKIVKQDLTIYLSKVKARTLILWGETDRKTPIEQSILLHKEIPNSILKTFPDIGHNLPLQHPELVYQELKKFL